MIKLQDQSLSSLSLSQLKKHADDVTFDKDGSKRAYSEQVERAKAIWKPRNKAFTEIEDKLITMCPGTRRCCYCEDAMGTDVEHFRPKSLFPELAFEWKNYLLACSACNSVAKRDKFSIFDASDSKLDITRKLGDPVVPPMSGDDVLINPRFEDPLDYLRIDLIRTFHFQPKRDLSARDHIRAEYTIDLLQLNTRVELVDWRRQACKAFVGWVDTYSRKKLRGGAELANHEADLKSYSHIAVWEEMKRTYSNRDSRWSRLKSRYSIIQELDEIFTSVPETLLITI